MSFTLLPELITDFTIEQNKIVRQARKTMPNLEAKYIHSL